MERNRPTMTASASFHRLLSACAGKLAGLIQDRRGIAAVEFAIIVPLLLAMYFVTMEAGQGLETNKKLGRVSSTIADLATQEQGFTATELNAILQIGAAIIQPYNRSLPSIYVAGMQYNAATPPVATVTWRRSLVNGTAGNAAPPADRTPTVPTSLQVANTFLVQVHVILDYNPVINWAGQETKTGFRSPFTLALPMSETYYLRARNGPAVTCTGC
jgi:Flp pilus assembly protein TadG